MLSWKQAGFFERNEFLIRRIHSLLGLIPVGLFMVVHLLANASVFNGVESFQNIVYQIHSIGPAILVVEWLFIFLPILFHALLGFVFIFAAKSNTKSYPLEKNYRYVLQRITGMIAFFFILWHVLHMNGVIHAEWFRESIADALGLAQFRPYNAASTAAKAMQNPIITALYLIGVLSCIFHFANGLWTMGITWGVWITPAAQERASKICLGLGAILTVIAVTAIVGLWQTDVDAAREREKRDVSAACCRRYCFGRRPQNIHRRNGTLGFAVIGSARGLASTDSQRILPLKLSRYE